MCCQGKNNYPEECYNTGLHALVWIFFFFFSCCFVFGQDSTWNEARQSYGAFLSKSAIKNEKVVSVWCFHLNKDYLIFHRDASGCGHLPFTLATVSWRFVASTHLTLPLPLIFNEYSPAAQQWSILIPLHFLCFQDFTKSTTIYLRGMDSSSLRPAFLWATLCIGMTEPRCSFACRCSYWYFIRLDYEPQ